MSSNRSFTPASDSSSYETLESLSESLRTKLEEAGIAIDCEPSRIRGTFENLNADLQAAYLERFTTYQRAMMAALEEGVQDSELVFLWHILKRLGVRPPSQLFELLSEDHFIEIYDQNGIQIFRNVAACRLLSYTLHELLLEPWDSLFERSEVSKTEVMNAFQRVFVEKKIITDLKIAPHLARESKSEMHKWFSVEMEYFAPLFDSGKNVLYMIASSKVHPANRL